MSNPETPEPLSQSERDAERALIDGMYDEAEKAENYGECPNEDWDEETGEIVRHGAVLCLVCGQCFKYCHFDGCQGGYEVSDAI